METVLDSQMLVISNTAVRSHMPSPRAPKVPFSHNEDTDIDTVHKSLGSLSLGTGVVGPVALSSSGGRWESRRPFYKGSFREK